jgi:hypothetical protein
VLSAVRWVIGFDEIVDDARGSVVDDTVDAVLGEVEFSCPEAFVVRAEPHPARVPTTRTAAAHSSIRRFMPTS